MAGNGKSVRTTRQTGTVERSCIWGRVVITVRRPFRSDILARSHLVDLLPARFQEKKWSGLVKPYVPSFSSI